MDTSLAHSIVGVRDPATKKVRNVRVELRRLAKPIQRFDENKKPLEPFQYGIWSQNNWDEYVTDSRLDGYLETFQHINHKAMARLNEKRKAA